MSARPRQAFHAGFNAYVPAMQYASDVIHGQPTAFSLGSPAVAADNNIATVIVGNAAAGTEEAYAVTIDARYGRTLQVKVSADPGAASSVIDMYGWDYLRQPMVERFITANASTAIQWGKKAFKYIQKSKIVTAATNAITLKVGTGTRLGLPYKGDVAWAQENGVLVQLYKRDLTLYGDRGAADAVAGSSKWFRSPCPGFVSTLIGTPDGGGSTNDPVVVVKLATVAIVGLTVTIDTSDTAGVTVTDTPTTVGYSANNRLVTGTLIEVAGAAAAGAKGDRVGLVITPTQFSLPVLTDPQTVTTGDPRGTYDPLTAPDGSEIVVGLVGDNSVNASNHGGLHGVAHVIA